MTHTCISILKTLICMLIKSLMPLFKPHVISAAKCFLLYNLHRHSLVSLICVTINKPHERTKIKSFSTSSLPLRAKKSIKHHPTYPFTFPACIQSSVATLLNYYCALPTRTSTAARESSSQSVSSILSSRTSLGLGLMG